MKKIISYLYIFVLGFSLPISLKKELEHSKNLAIKYLLSQQNENGSWGPYQGVPAYTALVMRALLQETQGRQKFDRQLAHSIEYLKNNLTSDYAIVNPGKRKYKNYTTAVSIVAFYLYDKNKYKSLIKKMRQSLIKNQFNQQQGIESGGIGYGSNQQKSDLSNTQFALEALYLTQSIEDQEYLSSKSYKELWNNSLAYIKNTQITEDNPYPWIDTKDKEEHGGFLYSPDRSQIKQNKLRSYGSMTYAGLKSMIFAKLSKNDPRIKAALNWIIRHYTVEENPQLGQQGYYYYLNTMAKTLRILDINILKSSGKSYNWTKDLTQTLINKQHSNGSWINPTGRWQENNPILVTSYSLMSLQYADNNGLFYEKY